MEKKSNGFSPPKKTASTINTLHDEETASPNGHISSDDEISVNSLSSPLRSPSQSPITESAISDHFANYSKPSNISSTPKKANFVCSKCSATFSFSQGLQRHLSKNSCEYHLAKKRKLSLPDNRSKSCEKDINGNEASMSDLSDMSDNDSDNIISPNFNGADLLCPDCGKGFMTMGNLNRHVKLSKSCGTVEFRDEIVSDKLSVSLPDKLSNSAHGSHPPFECTFCGSVLSTEKTFQVHKRKFRCRRRCKFCEFTASQSIFVQNHLKKEHNVLLSIDEIEDHNKQLFLQHFNSELNSSPVQESSGLLCCPVYQCKFSTTHKGGQTTHVRFHKAEIAALGDKLRNCSDCNIIGIPKDRFKQHKCLDQPTDNGSAKENVAQEADNEKQDKDVDSPGEKDTVTKKSSPTKKIPSLKRNKRALSAPSGMPSLLKLAANSTSPKKKLILKKKLSGKGASVGDDRLKCKFCDFVGLSLKHVAGHMNVHKVKRPRNNSHSKSTS